MKSETRNRKERALAFQHVQKVRNWSVGAETIAKEIPIRKIHICISKLPVTQISTTSKGRNFHASFQNKDSRKKVVENFQGIR